MRSRQAQGLIVLSRGHCHIYVLQFLNSIHSRLRLLGRRIRTSLGRYLHTGQHKQNKHTNTSIPLVRFEPTTPVFERERTVHVSDRAASAISMSKSKSSYDRCQSASLSWCQNTIMGRDQFLFLLETFFRQLRVCYFVAPSLTRGRVCNLLLLLDMANAVFLGLLSSCVLERERKRRESWRW
jgi:hypothetical protein